jgi:hypothetical protein
MRSAVLALALASCSGVRGPGPGSAADTAQEPIRLLSAKCTACHPRPEPGSREREDWTVILDEHEAFLVLQPDDREVLLALLSR